MRVAQLISLAIGVASTALDPLTRHDINHSTLPDMAPQPIRTSGRDILPFSISDLYAQSFVASGTGWNRSLSCTSLPSLSMSTSRY
jgi:hypothetical protein